MNDAPYTGPERRINRITIPTLREMWLEQAGRHGARLADALSVRCSVCAHVWSVVNCGVDSI
jgi:hypothetical protein